MSAHISVNCKHCGMGAVIISYRVRMLDDFGKSYEELVDDVSEMCECRSITQGIDIFAKQSGLSDLEVMWFRETIVSDIYRILHHLQTVKPNDSGLRRCDVPEHSSSEIKNIMKFYRDLSDRVDDIVADKLSCPDMIEKLPHQVRESQALGDLLDIPYEER